MHSAQVNPEETMWRMEFKRTAEERFDELRDLPFEPHCL